MNKLADVDFKRAGGAYPALDSGYEEDLRRMIFLREDGWYEKHLCILWLQFRNGQYF